MAWSVADAHPVLAVGAANFCVSFYQDEGDRIDDISIRRKCSPVSISWHPLLPMTLAVGWEDGAVSIWNGTDKMNRDDTMVLRYRSPTASHAGCGAYTAPPDASQQVVSQVHATPINFVIWSPEGSRLLSGDQIGILGVWKSDGRGRLSPICQYQTQARHPCGHRPVSCFDETACPSGTRARCRGPAAATASYQAWYPIRQGSPSSCEPHAAISWCSRR